MVSRANPLGCLSCVCVQCADETGPAYVQWAGQMFLLGCHLLSGTDRMAGEDPVEQKNLGSLICHHEIEFGPSEQRPGIINWDVLEK